MTSPSNTKRAARTPPSAQLRTTQSIAAAEPLLRPEARCLQGFLPVEVMAPANALLDRVVYRLKQHGPHVLQFLSLGPGCRNTVAQSFCVVATRMFQTVLLADANVRTDRQHSYEDNILPDAVVSGLYHGRFDLDGLDAGHLGSSSVSQAVRQAILPVDLTVIDMDDDAGGRVTHMARAAVSGTVLIVKGGVVTKRQVGAATTAIEAVGGTVLGAVLINPLPLTWI